MLTVSRHRVHSHRNGVAVYFVSEEWEYQALKTECRHREGPSLTPGHDVMSLRNLCISVKSESPCLQRSQESPSLQRSWGHHLYKEVGATIFTKKLGPPSLQKSWSHHLHTEVGATMLQRSLIPHMFTMHICSRDCRIRCKSMVWVATEPINVSISHQTTYPV